MSKKSLPQFMDETMTIAVALKRRLQYKNAYHTRKVCVNIVMRALRELCSRTPYMVENISINKDWADVLEQDSKICMENTNYDRESDMDTKLDSERPTETLIHGFIESQHIHDLQEKIIEITHTGRKHPLGIFKDKYAKKMNFPTLFYGDLREANIVKIFSYQKIINWEL
jgi:hypothetical protein